MFVATISRFIAAWFAYALPCYNTWKALAHRPVSEPELERLAMFWCVVGGFTAVEMTTEWLYSWFPFYYEIKTLFLLFLSLPQTQGSTFIFQSYVAPYFTKNEVALDKAISDAQASTGTFLQSKIGSLWEMVLGLMNKSNNARAQQSGASGGTTVSPSRPGQPGGNQGQVQQPPSAPPLMQAAAGLWAAYGPAVMGAMNRNSQAAQAPASSANISSASQSTSAARPESSQSRRSSQGPASPTMNRGQSSGYQARPDPRQVPLPASNVNTPYKTPSSPPAFPEPQHYR